MSILVSLVVILTIQELNSFWMTGRKLCSIIWGKLSLGMHMTFGSTGDELRLVGVKGSGSLIHDWKSPHPHKKTKGLGITSEKEYAPEFIIGSYMNGRRGAGNGRNGDRRQTAEERVVHVLTTIKVINAEVQNYNLAAQQREYGIQLYHSMFQLIAPFWVAETSSDKILSSAATLCK
jgi:hypothetical protein